MFKVSLEQFLISPLSCPVWKTIRHFGIQQNDPALKKWWSKVVGDGKGDAGARLNKYLQALDYFHSISLQFWTQMSINPTYYTVEAIAIRLTAMGDWLRSSGIDAYGWSDKFYLFAKAVVYDEPNGQSIFKTLELIWPAGLKGNVIHYEQNPFAKAEFVLNEGTDQVVISPPLKMFKFNPNKVWTDTTPAEPTPEPSSSKSFDVPSKNTVMEPKKTRHSFIPSQLDPVDSDEEHLDRVPFAMIANDSTYLLE